MKEKRKMTTKIKEIVEKQYKKKGVDFSLLNVGSTVRVNTKIKEGTKERIQAFEGVLIAKKGMGLNAMFTVRKVSYGAIGVERTFPINSPVIESVKVIKEGFAKRAKLYYIRDSFGRKAKREVMRFDTSVLGAKEEKVVEEAPAPETKAE
jgi:large subunit ribosomal protein L19